MSQPPTGNDRDHPESLPVLEHGVERDWRVVADEEVRIGCKPQALQEIDSRRPGVQVQRLLDAARDEFRDDAHRDDDTAVRFKRSPTRIRVGTLMRNLGFRIRTAQVA